MVLVDQLKKTDYNAKITETEGKIPIITGLATTTALNVVEYKIHNVSDLVKKSDYDAKVSDFGTNDYTTFDHNKFKGEI